MEGCEKKCEREDEGKVEGERERSSGRWCEKSKEGGKGAIWRGEAWERHGRGRVADENLEEEDMEVTEKGALRLFIEQILFAHHLSEGRAENLFTLVRREGTLCLALHLHPAPHPRLLLARIHK